MKSDYLLNLHAMRAFASILVVYCHLSSRTDIDIGRSIGTFGVDIFFVISGFVIATVAENHKDKFFARRILRIAPFYFIMTITIILANYLVPEIFNSLPPRSASIFCSFAFLPCGGENPIVSVGWTLMYEMYFYALFTLALVCFPSNPKRWCVIFILILPVMKLCGISSFGIDYYGSGIVIEFLLGFALYHWLPIGPISTKPTLIAGWGLIACLALVLLEPYSINRDVRFFTAGVPAAIVVAVAILLERQGWRASSRIVQAVADASYVLYLTHSYVIEAAFRVFGRGSERIAWPWDVIASLAFASLAILVAVALDRFLDKPLRRWLSNRILG